MFVPNRHRPAETERDSYKQQLQALQKQVEAAQMQKTAREMLSEKGIHLPDSLVAAVVAVVPLVSSLILYYLHSSICQTLYAAFPVCAGLRFVFVPNRHRPAESGREGV